MTAEEDIPQDAPHVFLRGEGGSIIKMDIPLHETIEERLLKGYLTRVNEDGSAYVEAKDADPEVPTLPTKRPAINAPKPEWIGWAVAQGMTPDDAEAATKTDLIEKFGATPSEPITQVPEGVPVPAEPDLTATKTAVVSDSEKDLIPEKIVEVRDENGTVPQGEAATK